MKAGYYSGRTFVLTAFLVALITVLLAGSAQAAVTVAYNKTLHQYNESKCFDFDSGLELDASNASCDMTFQGSCYPGANWEPGCTEDEYMKFNKSNNATGVTGMGPCKTVGADSVQNSGDDSCQILDPIWKAPEETQMYVISFPLYQDEDGLALITTEGKYVAFVARKNDSATPPTATIDYKIQDNGSNIMGDRPTTGCAAYGSEQACRDASLNGSMCFWDFPSDMCLEDMGGTGGPGDGGMGFVSCWIFDGNQSLCQNVSGCIYCENNETPGCENVGFYDGETDLCEPEGGGADFQIECANITAQTFCEQIPMLSSCCEWADGACSQSFESTCRGIDPGDGNYFCEDWNAKTNQTACEMIAGFPYMMPCKWNNETNKCEFRDEKMFGDGPGGFDDIGSQANCEAAGGTWKTETFKYTDQYGNEKTDTDQWCEMNFGSQTCDDDCWACEYQVGHPGDPSYRWGTVGEATTACEGSALGFCFWQTDPQNVSPSGMDGGAPGWCFPMQDMSFGGGNCDTNCFDCSIATDVDKAKENCEGSSQGCKWFWDDITTNQTGWCDYDYVMSCDQDCFVCYDQGSCENQGLGGGGNCQWDPGIYLCKPQGFSGEICFDGADNDNDGDVDCGDSDCTFDSFCGGDVGNDCGRHHGNEANCNSTEGCAWINDPFCEECYFCGREEEVCWISQNQAACDLNNDTCRWFSEPNCDINKTLADVCFNGSLTNETCATGDRENICVWRTHGGDFDCSSLEEQNCQSNPDCNWDGDSCEQVSSGFCDFKIFACFENRDEQACNAEALCNWMQDPFMPEGHCEPVCFAFNMFGGASEATCHNETLNGLCQLRGGFCEPQSFTKGDDCFRWKDEGNCSEYNDTCGWMAAPGGAGCDINETKMRTTCGQIQEEGTCDTTDGCAWQVMQDFFNEQGEWAPHPALGISQGDGMHGGSFCGLDVMTCFNNMSYQNNQTLCEADGNCTWMFNHCEPRCFNAEPGECNGACMPVTGYCQPKMMIEMFGSMEGGPPVDLAWDECPETNKSAYVDICMLGIKDNPKSFGIGVGVEGISSAAICTEFSNGQSSSEFYWYLDTDGNESNNCNSSDGNQTGFEFKLKYTGRISNTTNNLTEVRVAYKCLSGSWVATQIKLSSWTRKMCQDLEGAMVAVDKSDLKKFPTLYNQSALMRIYATSADNTTNQSSPADTVGPGYYTPGTADFKFEDCNAPGQDLDGDGFPSETDPDCQEFKRKGYNDFEDCFPDGIDNDGNGLIDCEEPHCEYTPACSETTNKTLDFEADPNDKQTPSFTKYTVDKYPDLAVVKYDTDEPANGSLQYYATDSQCSTLNDTIIDVGDATLVWDDFKPWHKGTIEDLSANITYYFKLKVCDPSDNCGLSACLNFTTKANQSNITLGLSYNASANATLTANVSAYVADNNTANYSAWDYANYGHRTTKIVDGKLKFDSPNASTYWAVEMLGVDVLKSKTINLSGAFLEETEGNTTYLGMNGGKWQNILQNLGVDVVKMTLPKPSNVNCSNMTIDHCDDSGNASTCKDVGNFTGSVSCNDSHVVRTIPITLGFSTYSIRAGGAAGTSIVSLGLESGWNLLSIPLNL